MDRVGQQFIIAQQPDDLMSQVERRKRGKKGDILLFVKVECPLFPAFGQLALLRFNVKASASGSRRWLQLDVAFGTRLKQLPLANSGSCDPSAECVRLI